MNKLFENLTASLKTIDNFIWGPAMLILLTGTGIFLTFRTKALCIRNLPYALKIALNKEARQKSGDGDVSPFSALATALASTIGTGNIVGVATAMVSGGPGALVWMWLSAVLGLTTKFSECMLAIKYREKNKNGEMTGGPMYTIKNTFKNKHIGAVLSWLFALFALIASFGIGNLTQANSIAASINNAFSISYNTTGIVITVLSLFIILKGIKSISKVSQIIVPVMAVFYIIAGLIVIAGNIRNLPSGIAEIFKMAFSQKAINGGIYGNITASMTHAMRFGIARGVFSNEAGIGSAAITSAAASTDNPVKQGYINMTGTFWDTIVICTMTGLSIVMMGSWSNEALQGVQVTTDAFRKGLHFLPAQAASFILMICLVFFAFTTILGWNYYGERACIYLFGNKGVLPYRLIFIALIASGAFLKLEAIWILADIVNGLMAIPNLIALIALSGVIVAETNKYMNRHKKAAQPSSDK